VHSEEQRRESLGEPAGESNARRRSQGRAEAGEDHTEVQQGKRDKTLRLPAARSWSFEFGGLRKPPAGEDPVRHANGQLCDPTDQEDLDMGREQVPKARGKGEALIRQ
jgi:hypothetical protein